MTKIGLDIIRFIECNRISTTEVADCLGKSCGLSPGEMYPLTNGHFAVGEVRYLYAVEESNWNIHEDLHNNKYTDSIIFIDAIDVNNRALVGDLVSKYCLLYLRNKAIVTNGKMRDAHRLIKENYAIWCTGVSPVGCYNLRPRSLETYIDRINNNKNKYEGAIAVCDDSGVVMISKENQNESFINKLRMIEEQEDIWYDCIDRLKWSTYDTVCLKKYNEEDYNNK